MPAATGDPLPKVTLSMLREPGAGCPLRVSSTHAGRTGNYRGGGRWVVGDRITEAVRYSHATGEDPRPRLEAARTDGLCEEQQAVLRTALLKYGELFPVPVAVLAEPSTERSFGDLGVRLVGTAPLAVRRLDRAGAHGRDDGTAAPVELRMWRLGRRPPGAPVEDEPDVRVALLLLGDTGPGRLEITVTDLLDGRRARAVVDGPDARRQARRWLTGAVGRLRDHIVDPAPRVGVECGWCPHVAACPAHREPPARDAAR